MMQYPQGDYWVVSARLLDPAPGLRTDVPPDVRARFVGRRLTRQNLQDMGVEIRGDVAVVRHRDGDCVLMLAPHL
jgi:hypothetical protein